MAYPREDLVSINLSIFLDYLLCVSMGVGGCKIIAGSRIVSIPTPPEQLDFGPRPGVQLDLQSELAGAKPMQDIMRSPYICDVKL